ncbi:hypothetical protein AGMMS49965_03170 [Bacteroidia bacterium]|nr:hypothetical protein AGMMS49965_03170 [Bacteroidia bacterium]
MKFEVGSILLVRKFKLPSADKDKFFIVIGESNNTVSLLAMTTSQAYFDESLIKQGDIIDRDVTAYCFEAHEAIGINGFAFNKNTFLYHKRSIHTFSIEVMDTLNIEYMDCLKKEEIINLIYSFYKRTPAKYMTMFEKILSELSN